MGSAQIGDALFPVTGSITCWALWTEKRMGDVIIGRWPGSNADPPAEQSRRDQVAEVVRAETGCTSERADFVALRVLGMLASRDPA